MGDFTKFIISTIAILVGIFGIITLLALIIHSNEKRSAAELCQPHNAEPFKIPAKHGRYVCRRSSDGVLFAPDSQ